MTPSSQEVVERVRELLPRIAQGPWHIVPHGDGDSLVICEDGEAMWRICFMATPNADGSWEKIKANAEMIALVPNMAAAIAALSAHGDAKMVEEARALAKVIAERIGPDYSDGVWLTCSGCHESCDGYDIGHYPHSLIFNCKLGGGCSECGGIGAIWDTTDYEAMGRELSSEPALAALPSTGIDQLVEALPEDWSFWLDDAASILRSNGTEDHAAAVRDTAIALRATLAKHRQPQTLASKENGKS